MDKLKLQLEYCYGIRKLDVVLDFSCNAASAPIPHSWARVEEVPANRN